jgi:hypothetical protein
MLVSKTCDITYIALKMELIKINVCAQRTWQLRFTKILDIWMQTRSQSYQILFFFVFRFFLLSFLTFETWENNSIITKWPNLTEKMKKMSLLWRKKFDRIDSRFTKVLENWMHNRFVVVLADARLESRHIVAKEKENLIKKSKVNIHSVLGYKILFKGIFL